MPSPQKNVAFTFDIALVDTANRPDFKANPTLATGDFKVSIDNGALVDLDTLPTVAPASSRIVEIVMSQAEMNGDRITIVVVDAAGDEWDDVVVSINTTVATIDTVKTETALIVADTNELQTDNVPGLIATAQADLDIITDGDGVILGTAGVDLIWDEALTGATHNVGGSAGKRLRQVELSFTNADGVIATVTNAHTFTLDAGAVATADFYVGSRLQIIEGTGVGQSRLIVGYTVGRVVTLDSDFITSPDTASLYIVVAADVHVSLNDTDLVTGFIAAAGSTTSITLDDVAVGITDYYKGELLVITHGTGAGQAREIIAYTSGRVCTLSPALVTGLDTTSGYHVQSSIDISEIVDEVWNEAQSDHVSAGTFGVIASEVDEIKTTTDKFAFTKANEVDANTVSINQAEVVGDGNVTPWDGV